MGLIALLFRDAVSEGPGSIRRLREFAKESPEQVGSRLRQFQSQLIVHGGYRFLDVPSSGWIKLVRILSVLVVVLALAAASIADSA